MSSSPPKYKSQRIKKPSLRQTQCDPLFQVLLSKKRKNSNKKGLLNKPIKKKKVNIDSIKTSDLKKKEKALIKGNPKVPGMKGDEVRVERRGRKRKEEGKKEELVREERKEDVVRMKEEGGKLKEGGKKKEDGVKTKEEGEKRKDLGEKKEEEIKKEEAPRTKEVGKKEKGRRKVSRRKEEKIKRKEKEGKKEDGTKRKAIVKKEGECLKEEGNVKIERRGRKKNIDKIQETIANIKNKSQDTIVKVIIMNEEIEEVGRREDVGGQKDHVEKREKKREAEGAWRKEEIKKRREEMKRKKEEFERLRKEERRRRREEEARRREDEKKRRKEKLKIIEESILIVEDEELQDAEWIKDEEGKDREDGGVRREREEWLGRKDDSRKEVGVKKEEGKRAKGGGKKEEKKMVEALGIKDCGVRLIDKKSKKISKAQKSLLKLKAILDKPKKLCNVNELENRKNKKKELFEKLREIQEQYGEKVNKMDEPKKKISHWDFLLKEMVIVRKYICFFTFI